jgi:hypothetical protein
MCFFIFARICCSKPKGARICTAPSRYSLCTQPYRRQYIYQHYKIMLLSQALYFHVSCNSHNNYPLLFSTCLTAVSLFRDGIMFSKRYDLKLNRLYNFGVQAISRRRLTAEAGVWSWPCPCYVCLEKVALGQVFLLTFQFYIVSDTPPIPTFILIKLLAERKVGITWEFTSKAVSFRISG